MLTEKVLCESAQVNMNAVFAPQAAHTEIAPRWRPRTARGMAALASLLHMKRKSADHGRLVKLYSIFLNNDYARLECADSDLETEVERLRRAGNSVIVLFGAESESEFQARLGAEMERLGHPSYMAAFMCHGFSDHREPVQ